MNKITFAIIPIFALSFFVFPASVFAIACAQNCGTNWCNPDTGQCVASAGAGSINTSYLQGYSNSIIGIINGILVPVLMAVAFIVFLYGVFRYFIYNAADSDSHTEGRTFIIYGIVGFVVILSVWGLVGILSGTLGLNPGGHAPQVPTL